MYFIIFLLAVLQCCFVDARSNIVEDIDPSRTIVWGPGLNSQKITLRARYIFLQLVDKFGQNVTETPGKSTVSLQIQGKTENGLDCPAWIQVYDCKDGSFILRFRLYNTCYNLRPIIKVKHVKVALKSEVFKGPVYEEECYCPNTSIEEWLKDNECVTNHSQILKDLSLFPKVNFDKIRKKMMVRFDMSHSVSFCHYIIKENKIYRQCYGKHVGFNTFADAILLSLTRKVLLPNLEFFINLGDWPLVPVGSEIHPMFSWCGSKNSIDIILPTYSITESSLENMGRVMMDILSVQGSTKQSWSEKTEKLFWRGRDSSSERLDLIDIARANPELFNASITNFFFFRNKMDKYGPEQKYISFFDFFEYKYQLNIDGTVAAYRFPYLLAGDSLVFKQDSDYYEFFYNDLIPGVHYIPIKRDLSNLVEMVEWAKKHDTEARKISKAGRQFVRDNVLPQHIFCYHVALFQEWSERLESSIRVFNGMEEVVQPEHSCECGRKWLNPRDEL